MIMDIKEIMKKYVIPFLAFTSINALGIGMVYHHFQNNLEHQLSIATQKAVDLIDLVFSFSENASNDTLREVDAQCDTILLKLREKVALVPFVRTITVAKNDTLYCSSLLGDISKDKVKIHTSDYSAGVLNLISGNDIRANHPLVIFRTESTPYSTLVSVDGDYIKIILDASRGGFAMKLLIGDDSINEEGKHEVESTPFSVSSLFVRKSSEKYPFYVLTTISNDEINQQFIDEYGISTASIFLLSMLIFALLVRIKSLPKSYSDQIRMACDNDEFIPFFQPLVDSNTERVIGAEVLMRWKSSKEGLISPDIFIPQAEASGLIFNMTEKLMSDTAKILHSHEDIIPHEFHIAFNITPQHLEYDSLIVNCINFYKVCPVEKFTLFLELTERSILNYNASTIKRLEKLASIGVKLALDDFGTGHSTLITLQTFTFDCIKIDKSFISRIGDEPCSRHIVDSVISLAKKLDLSIVAEGVENTHQKDYLKANNVNYLQGYLFSPPINESDFLKYIEEQK
ncbi:EAL domain-containing protein [Aeromonas veronii]|uniref:EAL domain-containing protein n=1 Tax=Aeromonas veronii TaxID=654 RepID=UPI003D234CC8